MKKKIVSILLVLVLMFVPLTAIDVSAASYPIVTFAGMGSTIYIGDNVPLKFNYTPAYNNEKVNVYVYDSDGKLCATSNFEMSNKYSNYRSLTVNWDTTGYKAGKYEIVVEKQFYTFYNWHTAPTNSTGFVTLVEPTDKMVLNNTFKSTKTHFECSVSEKVKKPKSGIENVVSAWKILDFSDAKVPYTIQLKEMYTGQDAEKIAIDENMFNFSGDSKCQWTLCKFEINNKGKSSVEFGDIIDWINTYLPSGQKSTLIDTCTFGDLPHYDAEIEVGKTGEAWVGFYTLKSQGLPFLKLDNGVYMNIHPSCASEHKNTKTVKKATLTKNGSSKNQCSNCGWLSDTTIYKASTVKFKKSYSTYDGKTKKPTIIVTDSKGKTISSKNYSIKYPSDMKKVGKYSVKVTFKGNYSGSKTLTYTIKPIKSSTCKIKLSSSSYTYDGKTKTPSISVKNANGSPLKKGSHYTVSYASGRKNIGKYKVTIKFKGNYSGTETQYFTIAPAKTSLKKVSGASKSLKVSINKKTTQVTGYEIQYSTSKKFTTPKTITIKNYKTSSATIKSLKAKTTYYVRVRTYKTVNGKKYYSGWSVYKSAKTK